MLSIQRLCKNNNCRFICDAFWFWIQDKITKRVHLKALYKAGLYPIPFYISSIPQPRLQQVSSFYKNQFCYLGHQVKTSLWHKRFGHPSNTITFALLNQSQISFTSNTSKLVYTACLEGKFAKLPFLYPAAKSIKPFKVIHGDVWGPSPTIYVVGFRNLIMSITCYKSL